MQLSPAINEAARRLISNFIPKRIVPFEYYLERPLDTKLLELLQTKDACRVLVTGEAGVGKTSLLSNIARKLLDDDKFAVIYIRAENVGHNDFDDQALRQAGLDSTGLTLNEVLKRIAVAERRKVVILLDTLDSITDADGLTKLRNFIDCYSGDKRYIIGVSRPFESNDLADSFEDEIAAVEAFSDEEIDHLFENYKAFYKMGGETLSDMGREVCRNPLHLRLLFDVYKPDEIPVTIDLQMLYRRYWIFKIASIRPHSAYTAPTPAERRKIAELKENVVLTLASDMLAGRRIFSKEEVVTTALPLHPIQKVGDISQSETVFVNQSLTIGTFVSPGEKGLLDKAYLDLLDEGVLRESGGKVEFFHQTYFEYSAARAALANRKLADEILGDGVEELFLRPVLIQLGIQARADEDDSTFARVCRSLKGSGSKLMRLAVIDILLQLKTFRPGDKETVEDLIYNSGAKYEMRYFLNLVRISKNAAFIRAFFDLFERMAGQEVVVLAELVDMLKLLVSADREGSERVIDTIASLPAAENGYYIEAQYSLLRVLDELRALHPDLLDRAEALMTRSEYMVVPRELEHAFGLSRGEAAELTLEVGQMHIWQTPFAAAAMYLNLGVVKAIEDLEKRIDEAAETGNERSFKGLEVYLLALSQKDDEGAGALLEGLAARPDLLTHWMPIWLQPSRMNVKLLRRLLKQLFYEEVRQFMVTFVRGLRHFKSLSPGEYENILAEYKKNTERNMLQVLFMDMAAANPEQAGSDPGGLAELFLEIALIEPMSVVSITLKVEEFFRKRLNTA